MENRKEEKPIKVGVCTKKKKKHVCTSRKLFRICGTYIRIDKSLFEFNRVGSRASVWANWFYGNKMLAEDGLQGVQLNALESRHLGLVALAFAIIKL